MRDYRVSSIESWNDMDDRADAAAVPGQRRSPDTPTVGGVETVAVEYLLPADSLRERGVDDEHVRGLSEVMDVVPLIVVHRPTMRVIDGMHRVGAARLREQTLIRARYFEGDEHDAFVLGVQMNAQHGLPLTLSERRSAALRILTTHPHWSDRRIALVAGLSPRTVGEMRRSSAGTAQLNTSRVGRDRRVRPVDASQSRRRARELLLAHPNLTIRQVAHEAGISVGTAHSVCKSVRAERDQAAASAAGAPATTGRPSTGGPDLSDERSSETDRARVLTSLIEGLRRDPSLRGSIAGRLVLRQLSPADMAPDHWDRLIEQVPRHCAPGLATMARACARSWHAFADRLESLTDKD